MTASAVRPDRPRRIVFATLGSFGDLSPYLSLAMEMKRRGHRPAIASSDVYRARIESRGLDFHPLGPDFNEMVSMPGLVDRVLDPRTGAQTLIRDVMMPALPRTFADLSDAALGADLLVSHPLTFAARLVAETQRVRWASTFLAPFTAFSSLDPSVLAEVPFIGALRLLGPTAIRAMHHLVMKRAREWSEPWNDLRVTLGLPPAPDPLFADQHSPNLALGLFSPLLGAPQHDWPRNSTASGFAFPDDEDTPALPPEIDAFLSAGPPPVVFTLGTAMVRRPGRFFEDSLETARRLGRRAILMVGPDSPLPPGRVHDDALAVAFAPFPRLFPHAAAIVHHGGVGTTGEAMRAGRPMLVVPFGYDQPDNAARAVRLGIARRLPIDRFGSRAATARLAAMLGDPACLARAARIGERISAERGTARACDALLALADRR